MKTMQQAGAVDLASLVMAGQRRTSGDFFLEAFGPYEGGFSGISIFAFLGFSRKS